jgi:hypothetical protein
MSGCGTDLHPGLAASVNGTPITEATIDDLLEAVCAFNEIERKKQGGTEPSQSIQTLRSSLVESLVIVEITDQAAEERGVTVAAARRPGGAAARVPAEPDGAGAAAGGDRGESRRPLGDDSRQHQAV